MKAIIKIDVPDFQIGQEVNIHFKDSMVAKGVVALLQEPCEDAISRQDVVKAVDKHTNDDGTLDDDITCILEDVPSVTPQPKMGRWVPVSERLPEPCTFVNVTCHSLIDDREDWVVETLYLPIPKEFNKRGYSDWGNIPMLNWGEAEVIAWVERIIPQPYKAESEE